MKNFKSIFLFITLILTTGTHKYYVSTTLIDKDQKNNYYKVTLKAFYDDIAERMDIWVWELLKYNECEVDRKLLEGEKVYLQPIA